MNELLRVVLQLSDDLSLERFFFLFHVGSFLLLCLQIHSVLSSTVSNLSLIPSNVFLVSDIVAYISRCLIWVSVIFSLYFTF